MVGIWPLVFEAHKRRGGNIMMRGSGRSGIQGKDNEKDT